MAKFGIGTIVDLYDYSFQQWRGEYIVIKVPMQENELYKIRNTKTNSQQFVKEKSLRTGRLGPFTIRSLHS